MAQDTSKNAIQNVDLDSLLDSTLDKLADMPEFKPFPAGAHKVRLLWTPKKIGTHPAVELSLTAIETIELADATKDTPLEKGAETSVAFMLDNELGQGKFKELMAILKAQYDPTSAEGTGKTNRMLMDESNNAEVTIITDTRPDKKVEGRLYTDIKMMTF